jgi:hypothetical protein
MKKFILFGILFFNQAIALADAGTPVGRYQISEVALPDRTPIIIMLDTLTGNTWKYFPNLVVSPGTGTGADLWVPIEKLSKQEHLIILFEEQRKNAATAP